MQATGTRHKAAEPRSAPRFVNNPVLRDARKTAELLASAKQILAGELDVGAATAECILFKAMHACGYLLSRPGPWKRTRTETPQQLTLLHRRLVNHLVNANLGLVYEMLRRARGGSRDHAELVSAGLMTLLQAVTSFDPWRGFRFSTYAFQSIVRGFRHVAKREMQRRLALEKIYSATEPHPGRALVHDADLELATDRLRSVLHDNVAALTPAERFIIERRFLQTDAPRPDTLASIGKVIQLSRERVRQIQMRALDKLRAALYADAAIVQAELPGVGTPENFSTDGAN